MGYGAGIGTDAVGSFATAYYMSIQPDASLTKIGFAALAATIFGILLNVIFYVWTSRKSKKEWQLQ